MSAESSQTEHSAATPTAPENPPPEVAMPPEEGAGVNPSAGKAVGVCERFSSFARAWFHSMESDVDPWLVSCYPSHTTNWIQRWGMLKMAVAMASEMRRADQMRKSKQELQEMLDSGDIVFDLTSQ